MLVFPAIDLLGAKAVRLRQGQRDTATVYSDAPWEIAAAFAAAGAARVHVVDLDAAFSGGAVHNRETIRRIVAAAGHVEVEVGGGVRSVEDCAHLFELGARFAVTGTAAIKSPAVVASACATYPGRIVVAVDAREGRVSVEGWQEDTEATAIDVAGAMVRAGAGAVLYTDIGRDGMRSGPNLEATRRLAEAIAPCPVIASGGVARLEDLDQTRATGAFAVIVGKALYEKVFTVEEAIRRASAPTPPPSTFAPHSAR
jgi:phosphoribosylformimino-5-aminoimidazole carboxamide ribotide isomerase